MAVLSNIRKRSGLLIGMIAFALLAFIVQDLFSNGFRSQSTEVGSINGKEVDFEAFRVKVANAEKNPGQNGQNPTTIQAADQIWNQEIAIALISDQFEKAGIRTGENHIIDNLKKDQNFAQNPAFLNPLGKFDIAKFRAYFNANPEQKKFLEEREKDADINSKFQIYSSLIKSGLHTTSLEGKFKYELEANKVNFDYVTIPFSSVKDSEVKISDAEILEYLKKNEKRYKAEETREIEFVTIEDKPSTSDLNEVKARIQGLLTGSVVYNKETGTNDTLPSFRNAANVVEYVNTNSELPYDSTYVTKQELPAEFADALYNLPVGEIYGPYVNGKYYNISKAMGKKLGAKAKASHILISYEGTQVPNKKEKRTKEEAKTKADAILAKVLANPGTFMMEAFSSSDDSSAQQGGDLGYFAPNQMVKPFNDFVFSSSVGKIGLVETDFGYHIINVTDKQDAIRLATVSQKIEASEATSNESYTKATKFEMDANSKDFETVAKAEKLTINPAVKAKPMDEVFGNLGNQRQIIKWAYSEAKVGDVKRFEVVNVGNVIAKLKKINEKGIMPVEDARPMVEGLLKNKKKAEKIISKISGANLDAIAKANKVAVVNSLDVTIDNPVLANVGAEAKVVGTAFGTAVNKISAPIEGASGVFVIKTKSISKAPKLPKYTDYITKIKGQAAQGVGRVLPSLKNKADIEDKRVDFY